MFWGSNRGTFEPYRKALEESLETVQKELQEAAQLRQEEKAGERTWMDKAGRWRDKEKHIQMETQSFWEP